MNILIKGEDLDSKTRKGMPLFEGCLMYFPDALLAVSEHSRKANAKHNGDAPLRWSKEKSKDHADCIARHLVDIGKTWDAVDPELGSLHATALAWRALALLQTVIERKKTTVAGGLIQDFWRSVGDIGGPAPLPGDGPGKWERPEDRPPSDSYCVVCKGSCRAGKPVRY